jgi:uncharacterized surface protein with fasciclin (FAS1) repeats
MNPNRFDRRRTTRVSAAAILTFSLVAAACGDDSKAVSSQPAVAVTSPAATAAPAATDAPAMTEAPAMTAAPAMKLAPSGPGCTVVPADGAGSFDGMAQDPAATAASNNPVLSTLVSAVQAAGLVDTLNGDGPFTIFAPTNDAFAAIPADQLQAVLADKDKLTSILTYHVVAGAKMSSADLIAAGKVTTVNGGELTIGSTNGILTVNGAKAACMDVQTANATVHIIGQVLLPA